MRRPYWRVGYMAISQRLRCSVGQVEEVVLWSLVVVVVGGEAVTQLRVV